MPVVTTSDGVSIAVTDFGGSGPPLVLAHATGFHSLVWRPLARLLTDRFRCVALDFRGHGDSGPAPGADYHWSGFARDLLAVVDGLDLGRPFAVGHSCGGASLLLAEQAAPRTFRALFLYEPIVMPVEPPPGPDPANHLAVLSRRRRRSFVSRDAAYDNFASKAPLMAFVPDALAAYVDHGFAVQPDGAVTLKCPPEVEAAVFAHSSSHDAYSRLALVSCPVTLACGEETDSYGLPVMEALHARLPRSTVAPLAGLGHFGPMSDPDRVAAAVAGAFRPEG
ncbi:MAG TPA: alpha/beta hydrolase [Acidimicrobiales bacterium]|nr:alpha/beta hydrolase [Acidimicrobiales bacterium]